MLAHKKKIRRKAFKSLAFALRLKYPLVENSLKKGYSLTDRYYLDSRVKSLKILSYQKRKNFRLLKFLHNFSTTLKIKKSFNTFNKGKWQNNKQIRSFHSLSHRLDYLVYKTGFSLSLDQARQFIIHGKVFVNNKGVYSRYHLLKAGDIVTFDNTVIQQIQFNLLKRRAKPFPILYSFLEVSYGILSFVILKDFLTIQEQLYFSESLIDYSKIV